MFDLVADVAQYPRFLPWCAAARVRAIDPDQVEATVDIAYLGVRSRFTTRNTHQVPQVITLQLVEGPFRRLHGQWRFEPLGDAGCKVRLHLEYQFASGLLGKAIAPAFDRIAGSLVDSFVRRAEALYQVSLPGTAG
jgi:ribosome-associated toxin RatA of RatAB toxin-antitoxin module